MHGLPIQEHIEVITNVLFAYSVILLSVHILVTKINFLAMFLPLGPTKTEEIDFYLNIGSEM